MKQVINIDASSLSQAGCLLNWKRVVVDGYKAKTIGASLVYGLAFHKYTDMMYQTKGNIKLAREAAFVLFRQPKYSASETSHLMDEKHLMLTCFDYWENVILKDALMDVILLPDGKPATEVTFRIPYYEDDHYIVNLCGTIDRIGKIRNGCYVICDFKTSSKFKIKEILASYRMSKQLRFYTLALNIMAERYPKSVLGQIGATTVGTRIDGVFLKAKALENVYESSQVFMFKDKTITEFRAVLHDKIMQLLDALRRNHFPKEGIVTNYCNGEYRCSFWNVCSAPDEIAEVMLERDFKKAPYDPLAFNKPVLEV